MSQKNHEKVYTSRLKSKIKLFWCLRSYLFWENSKNLNLLNQKYYIIEKNKFENLFTADHILYTLKSKKGIKIYLRMECTSEYIKKYNKVIRDYLYVTITIKYKYNSIYTNDKDNKKILDYIFNNNEENKKIIFDTIKELKLKKYTYEEFRNYLSKAEILKLNLKEFDY